MFNQSFNRYKRAKNFFQDDENLRQYYPSEKDEKRNRSLTSSVSNKFKKFIDRGSKNSRDAASPEKPGPKEHPESEKKYDKYEKRPKNDISDASKKYEKRPKIDQKSSEDNENVTFTPSIPPSNSRRTVTRIPTSSTFLNNDNLAPKSDAAPGDLVAELQAEVKALKLKNARMLAEQNVAFDKAIDLDKNVEKWQREANFWRSEYYKEKFNNVANKDSNTSEYHDCISMLISSSFTNAELAKKIAGDHHVSLTTENVRNLEKIGRKSIPIGKNDRIKFENLEDKSKFDTCDKFLNKKIDQRFVLDLHDDEDE